uniref:Putative ovule protein n=1 Tax=Solanum chacoense TaxID=4108 RepID=A0A0V0HKW3_SOLCH
MLVLLLGQIYNSVGDIFSFFSQKNIIYSVRLKNKCHLKKKLFQNKRHIRNSNTKNSTIIFQLFNSVQF